MFNTIDLPVLLATSVRAHFSRSMKAWLVFTISSHLNRIEYAPAQKVVQYHTYSAWLWRNFPQNSHRLWSYLLYLDLITTVRHQRRSRVLCVLMNQYCINDRFDADFHHQSMVHVRRQVLNLESSPLLFDVYIISSTVWYAQPGWFSSLVIPSPHGPEHIFKNKVRSKLDCYCTQSVQHAHVYSCSMALTIRILRDGIDFRLPLIGLLKSSSGYKNVNSNADSKFSRNSSSKEAEFWLFEKITIGKTMGFTEYCLTIPCVHNAEHGRLYSGVTLRACLNVGSFQFWLQPPEKPSFWSHPQQDQAWFDLTNRHHTAHLVQLSKRANEGRLRSATRCECG